MATKTKQEAQNPLILRSHRLMEAFAKSDDERDFYLDRQEGFIIYVDLDKAITDLQILEKELDKNPDRYCMIPKFTFYETKKIMEGFVNEKVYDIDTKEKLLDIIQSKEARENFLEFIYDHHSEMEKWQQFYQERSRIRIIEWLRNNHFHFVFEEDLDLPKLLIEKLKRELFEIKVGKDVLNARKALVTKAKTYYSNEALNPRPKRGRPPKQAAKLEVESQITTDIYTTVPIPVVPFLFTPDMSSASAVTFSSKFDNEEQMLANRRLHALAEVDAGMESLNQKLELLKGLSTRWVEQPKAEVSSKVESKSRKQPSKLEDDEDEDGDDEESLNGFKAPTKKAAASRAQASRAQASKAPAPKAPAPKVKVKPIKRTIIKPAVAKKEPPAAPKKAKLRPVKKIAPKAKAPPKPDPKAKPKSKKS